MENISFQSDLHRGLLRFWRVRFFK